MSLDSGDPLPRLSMVSPVAIGTAARTIRMAAAGAGGKPRRRREHARAAPPARRRSSGTHSGHAARDRDHGDAADDCRVSGAGAGPQRLGRAQEGHGLRAGRRAAVRVLARRTVQARQGTLVDVFRIRGEPRPGVFGQDVPPALVGLRCRRDWRALGELGGEVTSVAGPKTNAVPPVARVTTSVFSGMSLTIVYRRQAIASSSAIGRPSTVEGWTNTLAFAVATFSPRRSGGPSRRIRGSPAASSASFAR